jgi:hypothetical protein
MSCDACEAFDATERAAIEGREMPEHVFDGCVCDELALDVLFVPPWRFHARPQVGLALQMTWHKLALYLSRPTVGEAKDEAGAWSPALYCDGVRRKANLVAIHALVVDVDEGGDVGRVAAAVARYRAVVHSTFSSTPAAPRCRIVLVLAEPIDAPTYEASHAIVRAHLRAVGIPADDGAKDAARLSYAPVIRHGASYHCRRIDGVPLDARAVLAAQPPPPLRGAPHRTDPQHADAYARAALRRGAGAVAGSSPGTRHYMLSKEAFTLARLGVDEEQIARALLPAFVASAGEAREHEGRRTIRDAVHARRGAT